MRAACSPHVSHFSLLIIINPHCYYHESVYISQLADNHYLSPIKCVFIQLIQGMQRDNIPALTDSIPQAFKDSRVQGISSHSCNEWPNAELRLTLSRRVSSP